jgi:hypothetical protein
MIPNKKKFWGAYTSRLGVASFCELNQSIDAFSQQPQDA